MANLSDQVPDAETTWVRTRSGKMTHRSGCVELAKAHRTWPWIWAEGRLVAEIQQATTGLGVTFCKRCCPEVMPPSVGPLTLSLSVTHHRKMVTT